MLIFLLRRLVQACFVVIIISIISFAIQDKLGDPVQQMVGMTVSPEERNPSQQVGLNDGFQSILALYKRAIQGDLGTSYYKEPTLDVILNKLPATLSWPFVLF